VVCAALVSLWMIPEMQPSASVRESLLPCAVAPLPPGSDSPPVQRRGTPPRHRPRTACAIVHVVMEQFNRLRVSGAPCTTPRASGTPSREPEGPSKIREARSLFHLRLQLCVQRRHEPPDQWLSVPLLKVGTRIAVAQVSRNSPLVDRILPRGVRVLPDGQVEAKGEVHR
jgi:hypothetical protein